MQMSVCQHSILKVTSSVIVTHPGKFDWHKTMFSFHWISILLISVTFYTYLANIVFFHVTWTLNVKFANIGIFYIVDSKQKLVCLSKNL